MKMVKESKTLEYKEKVSQSFLKTVSAFANFEGGKILFGVTDDGQNVGIADTTATCLAIENKINDNLSPKPDFTLSVDEKSRVITLEVLPGNFQPYLYKGKAYRRSDSATIEVDQVELKRLILAGNHLYYEELINEQQNLTFHLLAKQLKEQLDLDLGPEILRTLGLCDKNRQYNHAGAIFADENTFAGVDVARFGADINEIQERQTIYHQSILKQYEVAMQMYQRYYQLEVIQGQKRVKKESIPQEAFREALVNALVHRQWDVPIHVRIAMFNDRIEITSPGALVEGVSPQDYLSGHLSQLRNPIIGNVFFRLHLLEMFGTGVRRIKSSYQQAKIQPTFEFTSQSITVILPVFDQQKPLTGEENQLLTVFLPNRLYSARELSEQLSWNKDKVNRLLNELILKRYVQRLGRGRATKYQKI